MADADARWGRRHAEALRRRALREQAIAYRGGSCQICGYCRCPAALDLHHLDPRTKDFTISNRMTSFEAIRRELDKCALLCATCHREVHDGLYPQYLVLEDLERRPDVGEDDLDLGSDPFEV